MRRSPPSGNFSIFKSFFRILFCFSNSFILSNNSDIFLSFGNICRFRKFGKTSEVIHLINFFAYDVRDLINKEYKPLSLMYMESGCCISLKLIFIFFN